MKEDEEEDGSRKRGLTCTLFILFITLAHSNGFDNPVVLLRVLYVVEERPCSEVSSVVAASVPVQELPHALQLLI